MQLDEAKQILNNNGYILESISEDEISDILWNNLPANKSMKGINHVREFLSYEIENLGRVSVARIAQTIAKLYNMGYDNETYHPKNVNKITPDDAMKAAETIKQIAKESI